MTISRFSFPTDIQFGAGASKLVGAHLRERGFTRPVVVTDKGLAALPVLKNFVANLGDGLSVHLFAGVQGNPTASQAMDGRDAFHAHKADCVVGIGGGAALDVAKVVALMSVHEGNVIEYAWDHPHSLPIQNALPCLEALPTTAGTGSEVGLAAVITDDATHIKKIIFSPQLLARAVFADPELTLKLPPQITSATGMDALTHNIESYLAPAYHPMCDGIALEGVRIAARALPVAVREPKNLQARSDMLMASLMGAVAFQKDLGATH
jgi:hypothetical protein